jgi:hypothetical protein
MFTECFFNHSLVALLAVREPEARAATKLTRQRMLVQNSHALAACWTLEPESLATESCVRGNELCGDADAFKLCSEEYILHLPSRLAHEILNFDFSARLHKGGVSEIMWAY